MTFANGRQARELIVSVDDDLRRLCWAIVDDPFLHYNGAAQVTPLDDGTCRFTWRLDLLPNELAPTAYEHDRSRHRRHQTRPGSAPSKLAIASPRDRLRIDAGRASFLVTRFV